jgi:hypothetical protein
MTKLKVVVLLAVVALLLFPAIAVAQETPPDPPCRFYGDVMLDGQAVPDGTVIKATIGGDEYTTTTPAEGYGASTYAIKIAEPSGATYDGATVTFMIGAREAAQTGTWDLGSNVNVDLSAGEGVTPSDGGITDVEVVTLAAGEDAYAELSGGTLTLGIPEGPAGAAGAAGAKGATGPAGEDGADAAGGIALPIVALVIAIIAVGLAAMGMRRRV